VVATGVVQESLDDLAGITRAMAAGNGADGLVATARMLVADQVIVTQAGDTNIIPTSYSGGLTGSARRAATDRGVSGDRTMPSGARLPVSARRLGARVISRT
jgi:hypothetical protein